MSTILHYISRGLPFAFFVSFLYILFSVFPQKRIQADSSKKRRLLKALFVFYLAWVLGVTVIPEVTVYTLRAAPYIRIKIHSTSQSSPNFIPFQSIMTILSKGVAVNADEIPGTIFSNLLGNILLFVPFPVLLRKALSARPSTKRIILLGLGFSICIEILQFFLGRTMDVDDIILNAIGVVLGVCIGKLPNAKASVTK